MRLPSLLSLIGFILLIAATFCPMLRPFHLFNMNVYKMNQPYGILMHAGRGYWYIVHIFKPNQGNAVCGLGIACAGSIALCSRVLKSKNQFQLYSV
jgi:hypothetical protein